MKSSLNWANILIYHIDWKCVFNLYKLHLLLSVNVEGNEYFVVSVSFIFLIISAQCTEMELRGPIYLNKVRTQAANNARTDFINCRCFRVIHSLFL